MSKFAGRDFLAFVSTYLAIILLVLFCLLPVCLAFERSEQQRALQEIKNYALSSIREMEAGNQAIFNTTRSLYGDGDFQSLYYRSTRGTGNTQFYDMTQLQRRIRLYYQNIAGVKDVLVYLPKFDYVLTESYIFDGRKRFYSYMKSGHFTENEDWLNAFWNQHGDFTVYSDEMTNLLLPPNPKRTFCLSYSFPMYGDANIRMLVIVFLNPDRVAKGSLLPSVMNYGFSILADSDKNLLASYHFDGKALTGEGRSREGNSGKWSSGEGSSGKWKYADVFDESHRPTLRLSDGVYQLIYVNTGKYRLVLGIRDEYFAPIHRAALRLVLANVGIALILGTGAAVYFAKRRARPIERILGLIRVMERSPRGKNGLGEIEDTILNLMDEIGKCKRTIGELDGMVANNLLDKLFFGGIETGRATESFLRYFGDFSFPFTVIVLYHAQVTQPEEWREVLESRLSLMSQKPLLLHIRGCRFYCLMETTPKLSELLRERLRQLRDEELLILKAGVSDGFPHGLKRVQNAVTQAERRLQSGYHVPGAFVFTHTHSSRSIRSFISLQELENLHQALLGGSRQTADRLLSHVYERIDSLKPDSVELRQMFFSLRFVYSEVSGHFALKALGSSITGQLPPLLPDDLDEYEPKTVQGIFLQLNKELKRQYEAAMEQNEKNLGTLVVAWVTENFRDPGLCAGSIADHFAVSEKYVFQLFKGACNETLNDRILPLRVQEGIRLLKNTELTVAAIARQTGFTSSNTMYKVFMRVNGLPPSAYRGKQIP